MDNQGPKPFWADKRNDSGVSDFDDTLRASVTRARLAREAKEAAVLVLWFAIGLSLAVAIVILTAMTLGYAV